MTPPQRPRRDAYSPPGSLQPAAGGDPKDGLRTATKYPNGVKIAWGYDHAGRLETIKSTGPSANTLQELKYKYRQPSNANRQTPLRYEAEDTVLSRRTRYEYDGLDRLVDATTKTNSGTSDDGGWAAQAAVIARYQYGLDAAGNITQRATSGSGLTANTTNYAYDEANQLCWRSPTDGAAIPSTPCATGTRQTAFDANGNETMGANGTSRTAVYNDLDQTTSFTIAGTTSTLSYLGAGQDRWTQEGSASFQHNVLGVGSRASTYFTRDESGGLVSRRSGSARDYYLFDALGSVTGVTGSSGSVSERYDYEPYGGREMSATAAANSATVLQGQFGYAGGYRSVGPVGQELYHFGQRFYDLSQMRWTQVDPIDQTGDLREGNRYAYAGLDPVGRRDPSGLIVQDLVGAACDAVGTMTGSRRANLCGVAASATSAADDYGSSLDKPSEKTAAVIGTIGATCGIATAVAPNPVTATCAGAAGVGVASALVVGKVTGE